MSIPALQDYKTHALFQQYSARVIQWAQTHGYSIYRHQDAVQVFKTPEDLQRYHANPFLTIGKWTMLSVSYRPDTMVLYYATPHFSATIYHSSASITLSETAVGFNGTIHTKPVVIVESRMEENFAKMLESFIKN